MIFFFLLLSALLISTSVYSMPESPVCKKTAVFNKTINVQGFAKDKNGVHIYCEFHVISSEAETVVYYVRPSGELMAEKTVSSTPITQMSPNVYQTDLRNGEMRKISLVKKNNQFFWQTEYKKNNATLVKQDNLKVGEVDVIDAGFDKALKQYWETLMSGNKLIIKFISIPHVKKIALRVQPKKYNRCNINESLKKDYVCFWVEPDNFFFRLLSGKIKLTYDKKHRRLMVFSGVVNVVDDIGETQKATISYQYF